MSLPSIRTFLASLACLTWLAATVPAFAQTEDGVVVQQAPKKKKARKVEDGSLNDRVNRGMVSIVTSDDDTETVNDIARAMNEEGRMRVVPILGESAVANVRDLLYLRGVDAGILNADVLPYLRLTGDMPAAQRRVRYVTKLYDKTVFLITGPSGSSLAELAGKKVATAGKETDSGVTARTVLSLSKIDAELVATTTPKAVEGVLTGEYAAFIAVSRDAASLLRFIPDGSGLKIAPLPISTALSEIYAPRRLAAIEAPSLLPEEGIETLTVPALLAVFDWKQGGPRYAPVAGFAAKLIDQTANAASFENGRAWREMTPDVEIAGWRRFDAAAEEINATATARKSIARPAPGNDATAGGAVVAAVPAATIPQPVAAQPASAGLLRLVAGRRQPLVDDSQQGGGVVTEILTSGLEADGATGVQLTWSSDRTAELQGLAEGKTFDVGVAWPSSDCDAVSDLSEQSAMLCDQFLFSEPILQVLTVLFAKSDSGFKFADDKEIAGKSLCLPEGAEEADLNRNGRGWLKQQTVTVVRAPTLEACFKMVAARDADAVMASEIEGRTVLAHSGLSGEIEMLERPIATESLSAVVARTHPQAEAIITRLNAALAKVKANGAYYSLVDKHLVALWGGTGAAAATP